ncbi:MAG: 3-phosphoglycerate dehydrogenase family protein [Christensenellales bacterium]
MYKIKTLNKISDIIYNELPADRYLIGDDVEDEDAILLRSFNCLDMKFSPNLLAIARAGAGYNNIPVDCCSDNGIVVFNTPGANANAVKELVFGAMLLSSRNLLSGTQWVQGLKGNGKDISRLVEKGKNQFIGPELSGKKLGVIGLGAIGVMVANMGHAINMDVYGYDPYLSVAAAWGISRATHRAQSLDELLSVCDYISLHIPMTEKTRNFISTEEIAKMKPGVTLLNFARGEIVDNQAVVEAVAQGKVARYIVDFPTGDILGQDNIICIPHLGASTPESEENCAQMAAHQLRDFLEYGNIMNSVNFPYCQLPYTGLFRLCITHQNTSNMVGQITSVVGERKANISDMINRSSKQIAYTILDLDEPLNQDGVNRLYGIGGIKRIRIIDAKTNGER